MKKTVKILVVALALVAILGSCKVVDPCPAYDSIGLVDQLENIF